MMGVLSDRRKKEAAVARKARTVIHVNQHVIRRNSKEGVAEPPITVKRGKVNTYTDHVDIVVDGQVVASVVYRPESPLSCGARVWVEVPGDSPAAVTPRQM
jgi:hypothetical protein